MEYPWWFAPVVAGSATVVFMMFLGRFLNALDQIDKLEQRVTELEEKENKK